MPEANEWRLWVHQRFRRVPEWYYVHLEEDNLRHAVNFVALDHGGRSNILSHGWSFILQALRGDESHDRMLYAGVRDWLRNLRLFGYFSPPPGRLRRRPPPPPPRRHAAAYLDEMVLMDTAPLPGTNDGSVNQLWGRESTITVSGAARALRNESSDAQRRLLEREAMAAPLYLYQPPTGVRWTMAEDVGLTGYFSAPIGGSVAQSVAETGPAPRSPPGGSGPLPE